MPAAKAALVCPRSNWRWFFRAEFRRLVSDDGGAFDLHEADAVLMQRQQQQSALIQVAFRPKVHDVERDTTVHGFGDEHLDRDGVSLKIERRDVADRNGFWIQSNLNGEIRPGLAEISIALSESNRIAIVTGAFRSDFAPALAYR